jgi:hypothetical protein
MSSWSNTNTSTKKVFLSPSLYLSNIVNDMTGSQGRFCNHIIRALAANFIVKKRNLKFNYGQYYDKMKELGIELNEGTMTYKGNFQTILDCDIINHINSDVPIFKNINVNDAYFQTKDFSNYLYNFYKDPNNSNPIISANQFKNRYNNNNDVFVHVRLGDVEDKNQGFVYYDKALSNIAYDSGYISSDNLQHDICKKLIEKYKLIPIQYSEVQTIMFGSTCKHIILTGGSFSYIIGLFGFFSSVYYLKGFDNWYPSELFYIPDWTEISI